MMWFEEFDPFEEIERMRKRLDRLAERMLRNVWEPFKEESRVVIRGFPVDVSETEDELIIRAELPGFSKDDVNIKMTENTLEISAHKKEEKREQQETYLRMERRVGAVRRFLSLPVEVDPETAKAKMENGILEIRVKKKAPTKKVKEIKVE
ncbi:MAG: Hsp20/alpha crystallin family protein [Candidatus Aenigmarchaeota archaeon]|nr:Hsp20/alpha crystallin family protein [Candidatus Aenigmarchaeota archaeon]